MNTRCMINGNSKQHANRNGPNLDTIERVIQIVLLHSQFPQILTLNVIVTMYPIKTLLNSNRRQVDRKEESTFG